VHIDDEISFLAIKIAKMGFYGGDPDKVKNAPVDTVLNILSFLEYETKYQLAFGELNNGKDK